MADISPPAYIAFVGATTRAKRRSSKPSSRTAERSRAEGASPDGSRHRPRTRRRRARAVHASRIRALQTRRHGITNRGLARGSSISSKRTKMALTGVDAAVVVGRSGILRASSTRRRSRNSSTSCACRNLFVVNKMDRPGATRRDPSRAARGDGRQVVAEQLRSGRRPEELLRLSSISPRCAAFASMGDREVDADIPTTSTSRHSGAAPTWRRSRTSTIT